MSPAVMGEGYFQEQGGVYVGHPADQRLDEVLHHVEHFRVLAELVPVFGVVRQVEELVEKLDHCSVHQVLAVFLEGCFEVEHYLFELLVPKQERGIETENILLHHEKVPDDIRIIRLRHLP